MDLQHQGKVYRTGGQPLSCCALCYLHTGFDKTKPRHLGKRLFTLSATTGLSKRSGNTHGHCYRPADVITISSSRHCSSANQITGTFYPAPVAAHDNFYVLEPDHIELLYPALLTLCPAALTSHLHQCAQESQWNNGCPLTCTTQPRLYKSAPAHH